MHAGQAVLTENSWFWVVGAAIVVGAVIVVICGVIGCSRMKGQSKKVAEPQVALPAATTATAPPAATFAPAIALAQTEPLVPTGPINTGNVAITIAEPAPTAPPATAESGTDLQAELSLLKMPELRKRAKEAGISEDAIEVRVLSHSGRFAPVSHASSLEHRLTAVPAARTAYTAERSRSRPTETSSHHADRQCKPGKSGGLGARSCDAPRRKS